MHDRSGSRSGRVALAACCATICAVALAACAVTAPSGPTARELDAQTRAVMRASFRDEGIATLDRLTQDPGQQACSSAEGPSPVLRQQLEAAALAGVEWPADGRFLGDWKEGEKLAQSGRGLTWSDSAGTAGNGANCYNCHQISKQELSYGTIGPSLLQYGRLRGVSDPAAPGAQPVVRYTWAKIWDAKATNICSAMPRLGHVGALSAAQIRDVMALLLDPRSPVNAP